MLQYFHFKRLASKSLARILLKKLLNAIEQIGVVLEHGGTRENNGVALDQIGDNFLVEVCREGRSLKICLVHHASDCP